MENFGPYFWQFRREWLGGLTIFSWVLGSPVSLTTEGLDVAESGLSRPSGAAS